MQIILSGAIMMLVTFAIIAVTGIGIAAIESYYQMRGDDK